MTQSRVKNSAKNTFFAALNMLVQILLKFAVRIVFVRFLSVEYLGLNTLFFQHTAGFVAGGAGRGQRDSVQYVQARCGRRHGKDKVAYRHL